MDKFIFKDRKFYLLHKDNYFYPLNPPIENPFKNYKQAIKFLGKDIINKTTLTNYTPSNIDFALITLFKSNKFKKLLIEVN